MKDWFCVLFGVHSTRLQPSMFSRPLLLNKYNHTDLYNCQFFKYKCEIWGTALKGIKYLTDTVLISRLFWFLGVPDSLGEEAEDDFLVVGGPVDEFGFGRSQS